MALYEIIYTSLASNDMPADELTEILDRAREKNQRCNVSGMLIYHRREFVQLLEGEQEQVEALYMAISRDPRHQQVYKLWDGPIQARSFAEWTMAFVPTKGQDIEQREGYTSLFELGLKTSVRDNTGKRFLLGLRNDFL